MATTSEIAQLRALINDPDADVYTDEQLAAAIDAAGGVNGAAADIWTQKAAASSTLVNVSESGSSRSLGDLQKNALAMARQFRELAEQASPGGVGSVRIRRISRP